MRDVLLLFIILAAFIWMLFRPYDSDSNKNANYDVYQYASDCKEELGITDELPVLSCLDGQKVPIYVDQKEILSENWDQLSEDKRCDNPHWLGGDMGCWTYSHIQVRKLDDENVMVLNCRQKGNQLHKSWFRESKTNLGMNQQERMLRYKQASQSDKIESYYLYNTFNDIGLILRNIKTGKSCFFTQYGKAVVGFLPPIDKPLPAKDAYLKRYNSKQDRPPKNFPDHFWYRDANQAFKSPEFTANAGCIDCHNAHGFKYSPYINSVQGIPSIYEMAKLPMLPVGKPYIDRFNKADFLQVTTDKIDGEEQLCTECHKMTTSGTCGDSINYATGLPGSTLQGWLTNSHVFSWMPPRKTNLAMQKKHVAVMKCCCNNPDAKGCKSRRFGPTKNDLAVGFSQGKGWRNGQGSNLCMGLMQSFQWSAEKL